MSSLPPSEQALRLLQGAAAADWDRKLELLAAVRTLAQAVPAVYPAIYQHALAFAADSLADAKTWAAAFAEAAVSTTRATADAAAVLTQTQVCLARLISDDNPTVVKHAIVSFATIYPFAFQNVALYPQNASIWNEAVSLKARALQLLQTSPNEGIKIAAVKLMEVIVTVHSPCPSTEEISLALIPPSHPTLNLDSLEEEGNATLGALLALMHAESLSSSTITAIVSAVGPLARKRKQHLPRIVQAFRDWGNLPPKTLTRAQVRNVERVIRVQLSTLVKNPALAEHTAFVLESLTKVAPEAALFIARYQARSSQLLTVVQQQIEQEQQRTRKAVEQPAGQPWPKRLRIDDIIQSTVLMPPILGQPQQQEQGVMTVNEVAKIPIQSAAELVIATLRSVPDEVFAAAVSVSG